MNDIEALNEANRCLSCKMPRCQTGCPTGMQIKDFIKKIKENDLIEAANIIRSCSSLSTICSVVCPHEKQCVGHCVLNAKKAPIQIGKLEKFVFDNVNYKENITKVTNKKVAIIGCGPAGIACALELVTKGASVTIYERMAHFGGVLSYGIPNFRLSTHRIEALNTKLCDLGVKIVYNKSLNEEDIINLKNDYDDIFISIGLTKVRHLGINGENLNGVYDALDFLKDANYYLRYDEGVMPKLKGTTIVVGAGNVAMDAARMAVRAGSEHVMVVYRRTLAEAPANKIEIDEAKLEGIEFKFLTNPVEILEENNQLNVKCEVMVLGEPDASGRPRPVGSNQFINIKCDQIISAIGQVPNKIFSDKYFKTDHGYLVCDNFKTSVDHIYAGGDIVLGAKTVVEAQKCGRIVAKMILENN